MNKKLIAVLFLSLLLISTVLINVYLRTQLHETIIQITNTTFAKSNYALFTATAIDNETHTQVKEPTKIPEQEKDDENV